MHDRTPPLAASINSNYEENSDRTLGTDPVSGGHQSVQCKKKGAG